MPGFTIDSIKARNAREGFFFFEPETLRFFRSKVGRTVYEGPGGVFFWTSEQMVFSDGSRERRSYTVRRFSRITGEVKTVGNFQGHLRIRDAANEAKRLAHRLPSQEPMIGYEV